VTTTEGNTTVAEAASESNQTITWTIDPYVQGLVEWTTDVKYAEMTYRVEINPDILNASVATHGSTSEHHLFKTNKETELTYTDTNGTNQDVEITSPEVDPVLLKVKKVLKDEAGNVVNQDPRRFNVDITKNVQDGFNHTESLDPGADYIWLTTLRHEGNYAVSETGITGDGITDLNQYVITYEIDGDEVQTFEVYHKTEEDSHGNPIPRGDVVIEVTNQLIPQTVDVTIAKEVTGNMGELEREFKFIVRTNKGNYSDVQATFTLKNGQTYLLEDINKDAVLTLSEDAEGYDVTVKVGEEVYLPNDDGEYTIELTGESITITVINNNEVTIDTGITMDSLPYILILGLATIGLGVKFVSKRKEY
ncbi:MAG TPA: hypothetical protein GXZ59_08055, partial [Clostridiaceae bacterium]|nr:hypothetical protein [Clostridiaceae bacterium]